MESSEDIVRVKEEPNDTWTDAEHGYSIGSLNVYEAKNFQTFTLHKPSATHMHEVMALQKNLDEKIFIVVECKDFKPELPFPSTNICKTEDQSYPSEVKVKKEIENNLPNDKEVIILIKKGFDYENNCQFLEKSPWEIDKYAICQPSCTYKSKLKNHINAKHDQHKLFGCDICQKSFGRKGNLNVHINSVHIRSKLFECDICRKSFRQKGTLKSHVNAVHNCNKPFECGICYKSFGRKHSLKTHINTYITRANFLNARFVANNFDTNLYLNITKLQFMIKGNPSNVSCAYE
ncbi:zinc finger protein 90-like [Trichogramma pretiosum]|uniref:zinc finger protein 90-like n=1 Tax=Trichogramma pretiosum TaxID=7493 RepID=UPI000C719CDC|nr:zinc finger protein 90-like [Trichogramma pretiosum]